MKCIRNEKNEKARFAKAIPGFWKGNKRMMVLPLAVGMAISLNGAAFSKDYGFARKNRWDNMAYRWDRQENLRDRLKDRWDRKDHYRDRLKDRWRQQQNRRNNMADRWDRQENFRNRLKDRWTRQDYRRDSMKNNHWRKPQANHQLRQNENWGRQKYHTNNIANRWDRQDYRQNRVKNSEWKTQYDRRQRLNDRRENFSQKNSYRKNMPNFKSDARRYHKKWQHKKGGEKR